MLILYQYNISNYFSQYLDEFFFTTKQKQSVHKRHLALRCMNGGKGSVKPRGLWRSPQNLGGTIWKQIYIKIA